MRTWIIFFLLVCPLIVSAKDLNDVNSIISVTDLNDVNGHYESKNNHYESEKDNRNLSMVIKTQPNHSIEVSIKGDGMPSPTGFAWLCDFSGIGEREGNVIMVYHEDQKVPLIVTFLEDQGAEVSGKELWYYCGINGSLEGQYRKIVTKAFTYVGCGFTVTVEGIGLDAQYMGCDAKNQCITLEKPVRYSDRNYTWENNGYQYIMNPIGATQCQLSVINPKGEKIVEQTLALQAKSEKSQGTEVR